MTEYDPPPQGSLLTPAEAGDYGTPRLATCSYFEYQRGTGTATRITRSAPRGVGLPNPRWTEARSWPSVRLLEPAAEIFRKGLPPEVFRDRYIAGLDEIGPVAIAEAIRSVPVEDDRLVLLCFESTGEVEKNPWKCHRRIFAQWWQGITGVEVPELNTALTKA